MSGVYAAVEGLEDAIEAARKLSSIEGLAAAADEAISELESVRDECQESIDAMGENLAQGEAGQQLQENIDNIESYISTLESAKDLLESEETNITDIIAETPEEPATEESEGTENGDSASCSEDRDQAIDSAIDDFETSVGDYSF